MFFISPLCMVLSPSISNSSSFQKICYLTLFMCMHCKNYSVKRNHGWLLQFQGCCVLYMKRYQTFYHSSPPRNFIWLHIKKQRVLVCSSLFLIIKPNGNVREMMQANPTIDSPGCFWTLQLWNQVEWYEIVQNWHVMAKLPWIVWIESQLLWIASAKLKRISPWGQPQISQKIIIANWAYY